MTTYFPQEPADSIRAALDRAEQDLARAGEELKREHQRLVQDGWLFETCFDVDFDTGEAVQKGAELLKAQSYEVQAAPGYRHRLIVCLYLADDEEELTRAAEEIDAVVSAFGGGAGSAAIDLARRRRPA